MNKLPSILKELINQSRECYLESLKKTSKKAIYLKYVRFRDQFVEGSIKESKKNIFKKTYLKLKKLSHDDRSILANPFTLELELINCCENVYREYRLNQNNRGTISELTKKKYEGKKIVYVVTAHPTESRSEEGLYFLKKIELYLMMFLKKRMKIGELERDHFNSVLILYIHTRMA